MVSGDGAFVFIITVQLELQVNDLFSDLIGSFLSLDNVLSGGYLLLIFRLEVGSCTNTFNVISKYSHNLEKDIKLIIHFFKKPFLFLGSFQRIGIT